MSGPIAAIILTVVVHVIGAIVLVWAMAGKEALDVFKTGGDGGDGGLPKPEAPLAPTPGPAYGVPLPDAEQAPVRLREPGRIGERYPARTRRPDHAPTRAPARERELV